LFGATNDTFSITNVQLSEEGVYNVTVTNSYGAVSEQHCVSDSLHHPRHYESAGPQTVLQGGTAVFTVVAGPDRPLAPLGYRWILNGQAFLTSAVPTLVLTNVQASANVRVGVTNAARPDGGEQFNVRLTVLPDFDHDGTADDWEAQYFGREQHQRRVKCVARFGWRRRE